jgi:hypothetical protein
LIFNKLSLFLLVLFNGNAIACNTYDYACSNREIIKEPTLCNEQEKILLTCGIQNSENIVSICAANLKTSNNSNYIEYRYGTKNKIQLIYKVVEKNKNTLYRYTDSANYTTYFGFNNKGYSYSIGVPQETYGAKVFLTIQQGDKIFSNKQCNTNSFGEKLFKSSLITDISSDTIEKSGYIFPPH